MLDQALSHWTMEEFPLVTLDYHMSMLYMSVMSNPEAACIGLKICR